MRGGRGGGARGERGEWRGGEGGGARGERGEWRGRGGGGVARGVLVGWAVFESLAEGRSEKRPGLRTNEEEGGLENRPGVQAGGRTLCVWA